MSGVAWLPLLDTEPERAGGDEVTTADEVTLKLCVPCCDWTHCVVEFVELVLVL